MAESEPISWRSIVYGTQVISSGGEPVGTVREVLGSDEEDIFHGLRVTLVGTNGDAMIDADDIVALSADRITTDLTRADCDALEPFDEHATYHLASVGWLRKHLGWRQDSRSDEEPG